MPDGTPLSESSRHLRDAFGRFATGVCLVTTIGPEGPVGFTANSFSSVSLDPPLVLWSPARASRRFAAFVAARHYAIHILAHDQSDWTQRFSRAGDGFSGLGHSLTDEGIPVLSEALARFDCAAHATHDGGDHAILVGRVLRAVFREGEPLVFSQGHYGRFTR
jgi:flavin reductase (DIM6/NTAB) family NADH-FMN oxidoreductase RutF